MDRLDALFYVLAIQANNKPARLEYYSATVSTAAVTDGLLVRNSISSGAAVCQKKYLFIISKVTANF